MNASAYQTTQRRASREVQTKSSGVAEARSIYLNQEKKRRPHEEGDMHLELGNEIHMEKLGMLNGWCDSSLVDKGRRNGKKKMLKRDIKAIS